MDKPKKSFQCEYCSEKPFTTLQNKKRHQSRKHKDIQHQDDNDNVSVLSDSTKSETNPMDYILDVPDSPQPEPIPGDEYLIHLRKEYNKYEHLYTGIDNRLKWEKVNRDIDMDFYVRRHNTRMKYILFKIALLNCNDQNIKT